MVERRDFPGISAAAIGARGKFLSLVTSGIHAGRKLLHTRPGNPIPGVNLRSRDTASNRSIFTEGACQTVRQRKASFFGSGVHMAPTPQPSVSQILWRICGVASLRAGDSARIRVTAR